MGRLLTHEYLMKVLSYDPDLGLFSWRIDIPKKIKIGMPAGSECENKRTIGINGVSYYCHRLAWFYVHGEMPTGYIVPRNGDFLDCRISNLTHETLAERAGRSKLRVGSKSGVKGVSWNTRRKKWVASIHINYRQINLGTFDTIEDAKVAYDKARREQPQQDDITLYKKREAIALVARQRRSYKRAVDDYGNCAWPSFASFVKDIGTPPKDGSVLVPIDASAPIGPGNFTWTARARYDKRTPDGRRSYMRENRSQNFDVHRARGLRRSYGMEIHEYQAMHDHQGGKCSICGEPERGMRGGFQIQLAVDHDHATGAIRGLLCRGCNQGVGNFKESLTRLRNAVAYIEHHAKLALQEDDRRRVA